MILSGVRLILQGPKILFGKSGILYSCLMVIFMPVFPIITIMRERILDHASKTYQVSSHYLEQANVQMSQYISADLGLETIFQLFIQTLLLLSARSETRTILGMERLFDPEEEMLFMSPEFLLVISISGSLVSCVLCAITYERNFQEKGTFLCHIDCSNAPIHPVKHFSSNVFLHVILHTLLGPL